MIYAWNKKPKYELLNPCGEADNIIMTPLSPQSAHKLPNLNLTRIPFRIYGCESNIAILTVVFGSNNIWKNIWVM